MGHQGIQRTGEITAGADLPDDIESDVAFNTEPIRQLRSVLTPDRYVAAASAVPNTSQHGRSFGMAKRMSKTLATELADRTMGVVNPQNREMALRAGLARHSFAVADVAFPAALLERSALIAWLLDTFAPRD